MTTEPQAPPAIPLSLNDPASPQETAPPRAPVNATKPPVDTSPMQVVREKEIRAEVMDANDACWQLPGIKDTVWQNYMLVTTEWPSNPTAANHTDLGAPTPFVRTASTCRKTSTRRRPSATS